MHWWEVQWRAGVQSHAKHTHTHLRAPEPHCACAGLPHTPCTARVPPSAQQLQHAGCVAPEVLQSWCRWPPRTGTHTASSAACNGCAH
eukprot:scaffold31756_cov26-Tisochrysis_lutea.AAC.2